MIDIHYLDFIAIKFIVSFVSLSNIELFLVVTAFVLFAATSTTGEWRISKSWTNLASASKEDDHDLKDLRIHGGVDTCGMTPVGLYAAASPRSHR